ncbi:MAG: SRPBCC domain-containing protein [Myxococcales bacterium]|nr:SRPBCC domain-containing protein [Myxococcales bacterium]
MATMVQGPISEKMITVRRSVRAPRDAVWVAWTSAQGLQAWFAPEARMALRVGGPFELLFMPPSAPERGSEGCEVLAFIPGRLLAFSWNAPPHLAHARQQHTWCVVELADNDGATEVHLTHTGWPAAGFGPDGHPDWPATFAYFEAAWPRVLDNLVRHLEGRAG